MRLGDDVEQSYDNKQRCECEWRQKTDANKNPIVVGICTETSEAASSVMTSLSGSVTEDIRVPVGGVDETSAKASEEKAPKRIDVIAPMELQSVVGDRLKFAALAEAREVVVVKECAVIENKDRDDDEYTDTTASGSPSRWRVQDGDDADDENTNNVPMADFISAKVILTIVNPSVKEYPAPFVFTHVEADYFATSGGTPWLENGISR